MDWAALTSTSGALSDPTTRVCVGIAGAAVVGMLAAGPLLARRAKPEVARDIRVRTLTWAVLAPLTFGAVLVAPITLIAFAGALGLLCAREFARATGLHRSMLTSTIVAAGIIAATACTALDVGLAGRAMVQAATLAAICILNILPDQPSGYIQRSALGAGSFLLFGVGLGRLAMLPGLEARGTLPDYRALACVLLLTVQMNDVFAYCCGRGLSGRVNLGKWFPTTSPGKTVVGHLGAVLLTVPLAMGLLRSALAGTPAAGWSHAAALAMIIAVGGQLGDLLISSVKRDVGIKDMGALLPGHGGVLDRCNSLLMATPAVYLYLAWALGGAPAAP